MKIKLALLIGTLALAATSSALACGGGGYYAPSYRQVISYPSIPHYVQPSRPVRAQFQAPAPARLPAPAPVLAPAPAPVTPSPVLAPAPAAPVTPAIQQNSVTPQQGANQTPAPAITAGSVAESAAR